MRNTTLPVYRYLRGYSLDPGFSTRLDTAGINEVIYKVPFERLQPGPVGEYVEVLDFDPASGCWYEPVNLSDEAVASQHGLTPSEGNPQFHQQLVYAVAMKTIRHFEQALGRRIVWSPRVVATRRPTRRNGQLEREYVQRLRIYPHALRQANAYYDSEKKALLFGYFTAARQSEGTNFPGGVVFTCVSPDIVAHETTHAILDSLHPRYLEDTSPDVSAFHEGFADVVALLQRFTFRPLVQHQLASTSGSLDRYNVLGELATQFGEAIAGHRGALRSMIGHWDDNRRWVPLKPDPLDYEAATECHERGAVLVATIFDAFQRVYAFKTRDLFRLASNGTGVLPRGATSPDLVGRLASEACEIAGHLLDICIRALDYCPPHDISFGDFFRALITADLDIAPEDETGYRVALIEAFRARGIFPNRVNTLSVDSLRWTPPEFTAGEHRILKSLAGLVRDDVRDMVAISKRKQLYELSRNAQRELHDALIGKGMAESPAAWERFLCKIGLTSQPVNKLFGAKSRDVHFTRRKRANDQYLPPLEVHTIRPAFRTGREGRQVEQVLITLTQSVSVNIGTARNPRKMVFRGGCSLVLSYGGDIRVDYVVQKNIHSWQRFSRQRDYMLGGSPGGPALASTYEGDARNWRIQFNRLHGG